MVGDPVAAAGLAVAWAVTGGVTIDSQTQSTPTPAVGPDSTTVHRRTATAALNCAHDGTATATAALGGSTKTARLTVACLTPVIITGLGNTTTQTGAGQVTVAVTFTVTPATAQCTAEPTAASVSEGVAGRRTLSAAIDAPGRVAVTVTCGADDHYDAVESVTLTAVSRCADDLGLLRPGAVTRTGAITADAACTSKARRPGGSLPYYARRHTFELARTSWVTVELESAASNSSRLDTYLVLLEGHQPAGGGNVLGRNDDVGSNAGTYRTNSRLAGIKLTPGRYTIEATTYASRRTGDYDLAVSAVTMHGYGDAMHVVKGVKKRFHVTYRPTNAVLSVTGQQGAVVTPSVGAGSATITVTAASAGSYTAKLNIAVPDVDSGTHAAAAFTGGGTVCDTGQSVVIVGTSVCVTDSGYRVTIRTPATSVGNQPARTVPAGCVARVPLGRWYLVSKAWPADAGCDAAVNNVDNSVRRRTRFYTLEITAASADVTIRLSSDNRDTHLALWRASTDPIDTGLLHTNLNSTPVATNNDAWNTATSTGYRYLDGNDTDSRIRTTLTKGVYVVSAAALTPPASQDRYTINVKVIPPQVQETAS